MLLKLRNCFLIFIPLLLKKALREPLAVPFNCKMTLTSSPPCPRFELILWRRLGATLSDPMVRTRLSSLPLPDAFARSSNKIPPNRLNTSELMTSQVRTLDRFLLFIDSTSDIQFKDFRIGAVKETTAPTASVHGSCHVVWIYRSY